MPNEDQQKKNIELTIPSKDKKSEKSSFSKKIKNKKWTDQDRNDEEEARLMKIYDKDPEFAKVYLQFLRDKRKRSHDTQNNSDDEISSIDSTSKELFGGHCS